jgi:hypothetical protein
MSRQHERCRDRIRRARAQRDALEQLKGQMASDFALLLGDAKRAGVPVSEIASEAGLSRQGVYEVLKGLASAGRESASPRGEDSEEARMGYWLKVAGTGENPFDRGDWAARHQSWRNSHGVAEMFPRRPRVTAGDRLIMYAAGSHLNFREGRIYAVQEVLSEPEPSGNERWRWQVSSRMITPGPRLEHCPTITDIDVERRSVRRQSHIRLTEDQGRRAEELISRAAEQHGGLEPL